MSKAAQKVRIFNEEVVVKARIFTINGFSPMRGRASSGLAGPLQNPGLQIFLIHGEYAPKGVCLSHQKPFGIDAASRYWRKSPWRWPGAGAVAHPEQRRLGSTGTSHYDMESDSPSSRSDAAGWSEGLLEQTESGPSPRDESKHRRDRLGNLISGTLHIAARQWEPAIIDGSGEVHSGSVESARDEASC